MRVIINKQDLSQVYKKLNSLQSYHNWANAPMTQSVNLIRNDIQIYPPVPPYSMYERTGRLGRGWRSRIAHKRNGTIGYVYNSVKYAKWVQSSKFQVWRHALTGWPTDKSILDKHKITIVAYWQRAVNRVLRG